jgi:hypothetical protein
MLQSLVHLRMIARDHGRQKDKDRRRSNYQERFSTYYPHWEKKLGKQNAAASSQVLWSVMVAAVAVVAVMIDGT